MTREFLAFVHVVGAHYLLLFVFSPSFLPSFSSPTHVWGRNLEMVASESMITYGSTNPT